MKKSLFALILLFAIESNAVAGTDLMQVYNQALTSDPTYQQAIAQSLATGEGVPINLSPLLPQASISGGPSLNKIHTTGEGSATSKGYSFTLNLTQTVFNYAQWKALSGARATAKQADATLFAAAQSLMIRVAEAYFTVLKDEDNLLYNQANKEAFAKQLDQIKQQYNVGLKTITDVYTAQASYDTASAGYIAAETLLADDKENLRAITGILYPTLAPLSESFPLISPQPADMESWVQSAELQNWSIRSAQFANLAALENVKQQNAGHFPTLSLQGSYNVSYNSNTADLAAVSAGTGATNPSTTTASTFAPVAAHTQDAAIALNLGVPIFQGGLVVASTNQAKFNYQASSQQLEQTVRSTVNTTRQSYLGIISGIRQIQADKEAIKSTISSLEGLQEGYKVGTQTLVDVLNQQQKVFQAQTSYATDRYAYVDNLLLLKQAAGTLSQADLEAVNAWLLDDRYADDVHAPMLETPVTSVRKIKTHHLTKKHRETVALLKPTLNRALIRNELLN